MDGKKVRYSVEAAQAKLIAARTASDVTPPSAAVRRLRLHTR